MKKKSRLKLIIAIGLTLAVVLSMVLYSPVAAISLSLPGLPTSVPTGSLTSFYAQVDIDAGEALNISQLRLDVFHSPGAFCRFYPSADIIEQSGHIVSITKIETPHQQTSDFYAYGYGYTVAGGYGYYTYDSGPAYGYGYGEGSPYSTQLKYLIVFNTTGLSPGLYYARLTAYVTGSPIRFVSHPLDSFYITGAMGPGGGGPSPPAPVHATGSLNLGPYVDSNGKTLCDITITSPDGKIEIFIPAGTQILDAYGNPIGSIEVNVLHTPPTPAGYKMVGPAYEFLPNGATFDPPMDMTLTYKLANVPAEADVNDLVMAWWDGDKWVFLDSTVDTAKKTVTAKVSHFTPFAVFAKLPTPPKPAALSVSGLTVSPAEVNIGQTVTIQTTVKNTGGVSGSYDVVLKVNDEVVTHEEVTVSAGGSEVLTFYASKGTAGTYTVNVNGQTGKFVVKGPPAPAPAPPAPAPPAPKPAPAPAPPAAPAPAPEPADGTWLIILSVLVAIIVGVVLWWALRRSWA